MNDFIGNLSFILDILSVCSLFMVAFLVWKGLIPALWRLGNGLSNKKIVIYAKSDKSAELEKLVSDLRIFKGKVVTVRSESEFGDAESAHIHLIRWCDFKDSIRDIISKKRKNDALIIYCPFEDERIDDATMTLINSKENSLVVNFRGRLLNDIVSSLITTSYEKK